MSSLAKKRQSWLDLVSQAGPTAVENVVSIAQVHVRGDAVQEAPYCRETAAALAQEPHVEATKRAPAHSGKNQFTDKSSKHI